MSPPLHPSELIFPSAHTSINQTLATLKKTHLSISNRLNSIIHDAEFVEKVAAAYQLPLIANERCGSWYVKPSLKAGSAYFKSTDGHHGQWSFSLRRLNLQVLEVIGQRGG
jgi:tRNA A64-2'-O-ribosylphosphate transferase